MCQQFQDECANLRCQYGMKGYVENLCNRCKCVDPCEGVSCSEQTRCEVELNRNQTQTADASTFIGVCRDSKYQTRNNCHIIISVVLTYRQK